MQNQAQHSGTGLIPQELGRAPQSVSLSAVPTSVFPTPTPTTRGDDPGIRPLEPHIDNPTAAGASQDAMPARTSDTTMAGSSKSTVLNPTLDARTSDTTMAGSSNSARAISPAFMLL